MKKIEAYKLSDGRIVEDVNEAKEHDIYLKTQHFFSGIGVHDMLWRDIVLHIVSNRTELISILSNETTKTE